MSRQWRQHDDKWDADEDIRRRAEEAAAIIAHQGRPGYWGDGRPDPFRPDTPPVGDESDG
jgi:hypothetical protein